MQPNIIGLSETRIRGEPLINIDIPGYRFAHVDSLCNAGGVAAYVFIKLKFEICKHQHQLFKLETLRLNVHEGKRIYIIGIIYRHPSKTEIPNFLDDLEVCISNLTTNNNLTFFST